jgi:membrane fusion protein (multidrug efflux system)
MPIRVGSLASRLPLLIVVAITAALFIWPFVRRDSVATSEETAPESEPAIAVATIAVTRADLNQTYRATGVIAPAFEAKVAAQVDGVVREVTVDVGARVGKDQPLAALDDRLLRADLEQAEAALARSEDERQRVALLAERRLTDAKREQAAIAQHRSDQAAVGKLQTLLALTKFPSPIAGIVTARLVQPGDGIQAGSHLFTVADVSRLRVFAKVPEQVALRILTGATAAVNVEGVGQNGWHAVVRRVYPTSDPVSHQTMVELDLGSTYPSLRPGLQTTVILTTDERRAALAVTRTAVPEIPPDGVVHLFVVQDGRARARQARLGLILEDRVEITDGVMEGDAVIVRSDGRLRDGALVRQVRNDPNTGGGQ